MNIFSNVTIYMQIYLILMVLFIFSLLILLILTMSRRYKIVQGNADAKTKLYYFDNNATTYIYDKDTNDEIIKWINCGNPSNNLHIAGITARQKIEDSRKKIADDLMVSPDEICFTGNATEANNIVLQGVINNFLKTKRGKCTVLT